MKEAMTWITQNPEMVGLALVLVESILMPFIPVKWNGLAALAIKIIRIKFSKPAPADPVKSRTEKIKEEMQKAVDEMAKKSAADKLGE